MGRHFKHHCTVMRDIQTMSHDELEELYNIEIDEDGTIWDASEGKLFDNLNAWAVFVEQQNREDEETSYLPRSGRHRYDDDY